MSKWLILLLLCSPMSFAEQDDWGDDDWGDETTSESENQSQWQFSGFFALGLGDFSGNNPLFAASHTSLGEFRTRFEADYNGDSFQFKTKADLYYDKVLSKAVWNTRELSLATEISEDLDIKIGRQILTWGTGDYLFLNDLFAKDWQAFFSGRDDQYLKAPSDSIKLSYYQQNIALDIAWTPQFTPDQYLTGERFSFYSPMAQAQVAPAEQFQPIKTNSDQLAARLSTNHNGIEYALYGYQGYWTTPQGQTPDGSSYFPKLNSWGLSIRLPWGDGLFNSEYASYNSDEANPAIANGQHRLLFGYEQEMAKNFTISAQWYIEKTKAHEQLKASSVNPQQVVAQYRQLLTLRLRYATMAQKLHYSLFAFYSPSDHDSYLRPSISYRYNDQWFYALGANLFDGKDHYSFFGQHQDNSNIWLRVKYSW